MPEYPDIVAYLEALETRILGQTLERISISAPYLLRTAVPPAETVEKKKVTQLRRVGKRICLGFEGDLWLVLHLMIAGRLHWVSKEKNPANAVASLEFGTGRLTLTEAGSRKRASLHIVQGEEGLRKLDPGGEDIFQITLERFAELLRSENHTLKRSLTDPRLFSGIGNAYSDEILWAAKLSPLALSQKISDQEIERLFAAGRAQLQEWADRLQQQAGARFPEKVTAFREGMAAHGRFREPCPRCGTKIQRIRYASNETNYCPKCQTEGRLLADRSLSRLLKKDWPRTAEELE